eukprot:365364-Chlamydomonas_euryale.AAC.3
MPPLLAHSHSHERALFPHRRQDDRSAAKASFIPLFTLTPTFTHRKLLPHRRQDGRGAKAGIIDAVKTIAVSSELCETVAEGKGHWLPDGVAAGYRLKIERCGVYEGVGAQRGVLAGGRRAMTSEEPGRWCPCGQTEWRQI